jgi:ABC-2 type transport system permease protein
MSTRTRVLRALILVEARLFLREPFAVFFTLVFPLLVLTVFGATFGYKSEEEYGLKVITYLIPAVIATVIAYLGLLGIPIALTEYREMGMMRRYRVSPLRLRTFLAAHFTVEAGFLFISSLLIITVGMVIFHGRFPGNAALVALVILLSAALLFSAGFAIAAIAPSSRSAQSIGAAIFFPMLFLSGATIPLKLMPNWLSTVGSYLPLTKIVDTLTSAWIGHSFGTNSWLTVPYVVLVGAALAWAISRAFRW